MKTSNHKHNTHERVMAPQQQAISSRAKRRKEARKLARAEHKARIAAKLAENPRLVRA